MILVAAAATLSLVVASPGAASAEPVATGAVPKVFVYADAGAPAGHDRYVLFELRGVIAGQRYRISQETGPKASGTCLASLQTEWALAPSGGKVPFAAEPVNTGKYYDFKGYEPCHGTYVLKVERRASSRSYPTLRRFSLSYPSFKWRYLPVRS